MERFKKIGILFAVALSMLWAACTPQTPVPTPTIEPQVVFTAAAQTAAARLTGTASTFPTPTLEPTIDLTQTAQAEQTQAALSSTPLPLPTATSTSTAVNLLDKVELVGDVTAPDGTPFTAGAAFRKTWRVKNVGETTWTTSYALVYIDGARMEAPDMVRLPTEVKPGELVDISVDLVAPGDVGLYRGYWKMLTDQGYFFGDAIFVEIQVVE
jgi:Ig-like domain from next to BRCA1 gene